jgi:hypothetical protein
MKVAVFYYTQSGQAYSVARSICHALEQPSPDSEWQVVYKQIVPKEHYPFPWNKYEFFDTFPETRLGMPPSGIEPIDFSDIADAGLVLIVGQSWFLSPSLPLQSFFTDEQVKSYLNGREIIFVNACRNMWLMTARKVKRYVAEANARLAGHIVLQDNAPNLVSVLTIIRWLMYGKQEASGLLPRAGVSEADLAGAAQFGEIIKRAWTAHDWKHLQDRLIEAGAVNYKPSVLFLEKAGHRMFGLWARFVRRKGGFRDQRRRRRLWLFYAYLLAVLFLVSPFAQLFFYLTYPLHHVSQQRREDCGVGI